MRGILSVLLVLALVIPACATVQITEFCPDPWQKDDADEYMVLSGTGMLDDITISDGEGSFRFPPGARLNGSLVVARSGPAYEQSHGSKPDLEWLDFSRDVPDVISGRQIRLANTGDELMLYQDGSLIQKIAWPADVRPREGQIHYLEHGIWDRRVLMIGQSRFETQVFRNVSVTTFVSPDCSGQVFAEAINHSTRSILVNMYEFSSPGLGALLIAAKNRGVTVRVLVEGGPVGGISAPERALISAVSRSGIPVFSMVSREESHAPYRYDHAKYIVIDGSSLLITSENFKNTGLPPSGMSGNRGWGLLIRNEGLAGYFTDVFLADISGRSVVAYTGAAGDEEPSPSAVYRAQFQPAHFDGAVVTPVLAPDTSYLITGMIENARSTIDIEQAYIKNESRYSLNPYLKSAINASRRGVRVRVLLDSYWYNTEGPNDNDEMAALINRISSAEHLPLEARCIDLSAGRVEKIHNKGVIVDDEQVLVSSINWNSNSPTFNREAGVIVSHPGAARYFRGVFDDDWEAVPRFPKPEGDPVRLIITALVILILGFVYLRRHRL